MKDLNKILKTFTKTVAKLKDLEKKNTTKCKELDFTINKLKVEKSNSRKEADSASRIADKLKDLLS